MLFINFLTIRKEVKMDYLKEIYDLLNMWFYAWLIGYGFKVILRNLRKGRM